MNYTNDIFDYLGIIGREDSYTNLVKVLFNNVPNYKHALIELLFKKSFVDVSDFYLETRRKYHRVDENGNEIPDIIIVDSSGNHFALIEVKVFASEGEKQTERYYNMFSKIEDASVYYSNKEVKLNKETDRRFFYLTIYGDKPNCKDFNKITWREIVNPLRNISVEDEFLSALLKSIINKVDSAHIDVNSIPDETFWSEAMGCGWANEMSMFELLQKHVFDETNWPYHDHWNGYNKDSNTYELRCLFGKEKWNGKHLKEFVREGIDASEIRKCYQFHYEFAYDPASYNLTIRLDYHLNPYLSRSDIEKKKFKEYTGFKGIGNEEILYISRIAEDASKGTRRTIALELKNDFSEKLVDAFGEKLIKRACDYPMVLASLIITDTNKKSIKEVVCEVNKFVCCTKSSIDRFSNTVV